MALKKESDTVYPDWAIGGAQKALIDFGWPDTQIVIRLDTAIKVAKPHDWVGNKMKEKVVARALRMVLPDDFGRFEELFELVKARDEYR